MVMVEQQVSSIMQERIVRDLSLVSLIVVSSFQRRNLTSVVVYMAERRILIRTRISVSAPGIRLTKWKDMSSLELRILV